jgi:GT2 family glycosyltransferase
VVIPTRPGSKWLRPCLDALGTGVAPWLVAESHPGAGPWVPCARGDGFARRVNLGARAALAAGADRIVLLNDDTRVEPGAIALLAEAARGGIAGALLLEPDGRVQSAGFRWQPRTGRLRALRRAGGPVDAVSAAAMAIDAVAFLALGGLDEGFSWYWEDIDLCLRARDRGLPVVLVSEARVMHWGGGTLGRHNAQAAFHMARGHARMSRSRGEGWPRALGWDLAWGLRSGPRALRAVLRGWRSDWEERQAATAPVSGAPVEGGFGIVPPVPAAGAGEHGGQ